MNNLNIIEPATESQDWLFKKMAGRFEGWAIKGEVGSTDVPLNTLDYFAVRVLAQTIGNNSKTVLAVPRITPGVSLSLVSYLTVNRLIANKSKGVDALGLMFDGFKSIPMSPNTPIVVITKNRKLRDYYLSSVLNFGGQVFPFKDFPLFRIKRSADLVPLISNTSSPYDLAPVVFYHLDELEDTPRTLKGAVVLVELDTLTTYTTLNRLEQFLSSISPTAVLAVTSTFSTQTLNELKKSGFGLVTLRPEHVRSYIGEKENLPSFSSSMSKIPSLAEVHGDLIQGATVDVLLHRLNNQLNEISKTLSPDLPSVFYSARTILATLRNLSVPLESIEQFRKSSSYLRTIKFLLEKIFTNRYLDLSPKQEAVIKPIWDAIGADFFELYKLLQISNPKYEYLIDKIVSSSLDQDSVVLFYDSIQLSGSH